MRKLVLLIATAGGAGLVPRAPGTMGAVVGVVLWLPLRLAGPAVFSGCVAALIGLGVWSASRAEAYLGRHDDGLIVIDEVAGALVSLAFLPARIEVVVMALALFRLLDIWKPPPVRTAERLPGGLGVMADDLVAGLLANAIGQGVWRWLLPGGLAG